MIEQVLLAGADVLALPTDAHIFGWPDIVEAMTTVESGTAVAIDYIRPRRARRDPRGRHAVHEPPLHEGHPLHTVVDP